MQSLKKQLHSLYFIDIDCLYINLVAYFYLKTSRDFMKPFGKLVINLYFLGQRHR